MRLYLRTFLVLAATLVGPVTAQVVRIPPRGIVPPEVLESARQATQALADEVVRGDLAAPIRKMYPEWKTKEAAKVGGVKKLEARALKAVQELRAKGVKINVMRAEQPFSAFEVDFGLRGQQKKPIYRKWLVFVPTTSIITAMNSAKNPPEVVDMRMESYQIAISDKGRNNWSFLDGNQIEAFQLRQLFPFLPKNNRDLALPKVGGKIIKNR